MANDHFGYIGNRRIPYPNKEYVESFTALAGGMNVFDHPFALPNNETPLVENLSWHNGSLNSRLGQKKTDHDFTMDTTYDSVVVCAPFLFHGYVLAEIAGSVIGLEIRAHKLRLEGTTPEQPLYKEYHYTLTSTEPDPHPYGVFVRYRELVFFKAKGVFAKIEWNYADDSLTITTALASAFVPTLQIDANPATGYGESYQQPNRLSLSRKVVYNGHTGDRFFQFPEQENIDITVPTSVKVNGDSKLATPSTQAPYGVTLDVALAADATVEVEYRLNSSQDIETLLDTSAAIVYGGTQELCLVLGGPSAQPNAYFWSGIDGVAMNPTYFPANQYNLAGEVDAPITAFGKQQNMLVIFQPNAVGRAVLSTTRIGGTDEEVGLETITMDYTRINAEIGCDLPGSLQLVENNLVWCNRKYGVCRLKDSSAAYENNLAVISRKINGSPTRPCLLNMLSQKTESQVCSTDTGKRYVLVIGTDAFEWNYELSEWGNPSWFKHTGIQGVGFIPLENDTLYQVSSDGGIWKYDVQMYDGHPLGTHTAIPKQYYLPPRYLGGYDRLKNIMSAIFTTRGDTKQNTTLTYICDYKSRVDPTNLVVAAGGSADFAKVFRRKPGYHNIRHIGIKLSNNVAGDDLSIVTAQIYYTYRGRQR